MKLFPEDNDVSLYETGFEIDVLERKPISKQLSDLVERIENPIVLALDDKWGSGKTYFLKRWVAAHKNENGGKAITVYFDAFESDYLSDPFVSIITAVSERIPKEQQSTLNKWKTVAAKLAKPTFGIALSLATFGAKQQLEEIGDVVADAVSSEAKDAAQQLWDTEKERKDAMKIFKELLVKLTSDEAVPIVIVVDELDRCRPDYALQVLEVIKHFFAVPKVHFILGVNAAALENSVKARYGADIDAEAYLRKFINVSFSLPRTIGTQRGQSVLVRYATQLIADMNLPGNVPNRCIELLEHVATQKEVSLRDVGKVFSKISLLPKEVFEKKFHEGWIDILCVLLVSSVVNPNLHKKLVSANASIDEIREFIGATPIKTTEVIEGNYNGEFNHDLTYWLVSILFCCGPSAALNSEDLPSWKSEIGKTFGSFRSSREPKTIPAEIQKIWVDVFRI
jgi:KAP family P-loop domain